MACASNSTDTNQRCFTWTGPFGGGKSSLAVALGERAASRTRLCEPRRDKPCAWTAKPAFDKAFPVRKGWLIVPAVGRRGSVVATLYAALRRAQGKSGRRPQQANRATAHRRALPRGQDRPHDGVLVIIDEMGKFLEASALGSGDDVYFFQAAGRSRRPRRRPPGGRGRAASILRPVFGAAWASTPATTGPKSKAATSTCPSSPRATKWSSSSAARSRPSAARHGCAKRPRPSRRRSGRAGPPWAEVRRSLGRLAGRCIRPWPRCLARYPSGSSARTSAAPSASLSSVEPHGFRSYLKSTPIKSDATWYRPSNYWDYLRSNLEPAILASPDGHRWSQAVEAVERAEAKTGDPFLVALIKNIAVIDLFRNGSGLAADSAVVGAIFYTRPAAEIEKAPRKLSSIARGRSSRSTSALGRCSRAATSTSTPPSPKALAASPGVDYAHLAQLMGLHPVVAKRHYHETGTMRWMSLSLCRHRRGREMAEKYVPSKGEFGMFVLALPGRAWAPRRRCAGRRSAPGAPLACDWSAFRETTPASQGSPPNWWPSKPSRIATNSGDAVARREVYARLASREPTWKSSSKPPCAAAQWFDGSDEPVDAGSSLTPVASELADELYSSAALGVERVGQSRQRVEQQRQSPARPAASDARRMRRRRPGHRRLPRRARPLRDLAAHDRTPPAGRRRALALLAARRRGRGRISPTCGKRLGSCSSTHRRGSRPPTILELWSSPPFGMKAGIQPVVLAAFLLAHKPMLRSTRTGCSSRA